MARLEEVDYLKGVAITMIVLFHCLLAIYTLTGGDDFRSFSGGLLFSYSVDFSSLESASRGLLELTGLGYQGVRVFVIVSGFLQTWTAKNRRIDLKEYYSKRVLRLYPTYWIAVLGIATVNFVLYGNLGATSAELAGIFVGFAPLLRFNPSFWFLLLIVQLYVLFPFLHTFLMREKEKKLLLLTGLLSLFSIWVSLGVPLVAAFFFGSWLFEFSVGMIMANHYAEINPKLSGITAMALSCLGYLSGLFLSSYALTWPFGRPLYGLSLTLLLWSTYNTTKDMAVFQGIKKAFLFLGQNSYSIYLIHQPFIHEYFVAVTGLPLFVTLEGEKFGALSNFSLLPISTYLIVVASYFLIMTILSFALTKFENRLVTRLSTRNVKQAR